MNLKKLLIKFFKSSATPIIMTLLLLSVVPLTVMAGQYGSGTNGWGSGGGSDGYNANGLAYNTAIAYAFYIDTDDWLSESAKQKIENSPEQITDDELYVEVTNHYARKYPMRAEGLSYVYLLPTEQTPNESDKAYQLANCTKAFETDYTYSSFEDRGDANVWHTAANWNEYSNWETDGRKYIYDQVSAGKRFQDVDWKSAVRSQDEAKAVAAWLVSGGSAEVTRRCRAFIYSDAQAGVYPFQDYSAEQVSTMQKAAYLDLAAIFWHLANNDYEAWGSAVDLIAYNFDGEYPRSGKVEGCPIICVDRAIGFEGENAVFDGIDYFQYATGMTAVSNLRQGWSSNTSIASSETRSLVPALLNYIDDYEDPGRSIPVSNKTSAGKVGRFGPVGRLLGINSYDDAKAGRINETGKALWAELHANNMYGYNIIYCSSLGDRQGGKGRHGISTDEPKKVVLPKGSGTIGEDVPVHFEVNQTKSEMGNQFLEALDNLNDTLQQSGQQVQWQLGVCLYRQASGSIPAPTDNIQNLTLECQNPEVIDTMPAECRDDTAEWATTYGDKLFYTSNYEQFRNALTSESLVDFIDHTADDTITDFKRYDYYSTARVRVQKEDGSYYGSSSMDNDTKSFKVDAYGWIELMPDPGHDYKEFKVNDNPYHYDSDPIAYSEVKQNEPMQEEWEAMSGTPTDKPLYFTSGGSEFAVTIDCTPIEGYLTRNFKVYFDGWRDEHYGTYGPCSCCGAHYPHGKCPGKICSCSSGGQQFDWTQRINYSYMRINNVRVWRVKTSAVTGMKELSPMNSDESGDIVAQICKGDEEGSEIYTSIFTDTSTQADGSERTGSMEGGRIHWTEQPEEKDVTYHITNSASSTAPWGKGQSEGGGSCSEHYKINPQEIADYKSLKDGRKDEAYVQSDYVILHTKEGDMVLNYSEAHGEASNLEDTINCTMDTNQMWWNNSLCPSQWKPDEINQIWYNGNYQSPEQCFQKKVSQYTFKPEMFTPMDMHWYESKTEIDKQAYNQGWLTKQVEHTIEKPTDSDFNKYPMNVRWKHSYDGYAYDDGELYTEASVYNYKTEAENIAPQSCTGDMELWRQFNPLLTYKNGEYDVGNSSILYERILCYEDTSVGHIQSPLERKGNGSNVAYYDRWQSGLTLEDEAKYYYDSTKDYLVVHSSYTDVKDNCNNIVIHNPVSSEYSYVLTLPKERDQRTDRSKALASKDLQAVSGADSMTKRVPNPNYHNNLLFNPFTSNKDIGGGHIGWKTSIGTALGWNTKVVGDNESYIFSCDVDKGILIKNDGSTNVMYYQDVKAISGDTYVLKYKADVMNGEKAICSLQYLDGAGQLLSSSEGAMTVRVCILQSKVGQTLIHDLELYDMTTSGFIPNTIKVYNEKYVTEIDNTETNESESMSYYRYVFKDEETENIVLAYSDIGCRFGDRVRGSYIKNVTSRADVVDGHYYTFEGYSMSYIADAQDELEDGLLRIAGTYSGTNLIRADGSKGNTVVGKAFRYTGSSQLFLVPEDGYYFIEAYGANGGNSINDDETNYGAQGSYESGVVYLRANQILAMNVGGRGNNSTTSEEINQIKQLINEYNTNSQDAEYTGSLEADISNILDALNSQDIIIALSSQGGYNGGGYASSMAASGGGASDVRLYESSESADLDSAESLTHRILVAGGGAGAGKLSATDATSNSAQEYYGESAMPSTEHGFEIDRDNFGNLLFGAGGGGYMGGLAETMSNGASAGTDYRSEDFNDDNSGVDKCIESYDGNGKIQITYMKYFSNDGMTNINTYYTKVLSEHQYDNNVPEEAYTTETIDNSINISNSYDTNDDGTVKSCDTFINLDYGFSIYFPNTGDFKEEPNMHGILDVTESKGLGYTDSMDTTEWTYSKYVQFPFKVIFENVRYDPNEKIYLDVNKEYFDFYCVLGNQEMSSAKVKMVALAINNQSVHLKGSSSLPELYKNNTVCQAGSDNELARQHPNEEIYKTPMDDAVSAEYILDGAYVLDAEHDSTHTGHYSHPHTGECVYNKGVTSATNHEDVGGISQRNNDCFAFKQFEYGSGSCDNTRRNNNFDRSGEAIAAKHSATETDIIDVVGRIGNYVIDDVGDPRFANFFKQADGSGNFIWAGVIPTVDQSRQNNTVGDLVDIRGIDITKQISDNVDNPYNRGNSSNTKDNPLRENYNQNFWTNQQNEPGTGKHKMPVGEGTTCPQKDGRPGNGYGDSANDPKQQTTYNQSALLGDTAIKNNAYLNTYAKQMKVDSSINGLHDHEFGQLPYKEDDTDLNSFPLVGQYNNLKALRDQELRMGYPVYQDIQTIGNYGNGRVQVAPYYYALDLDSDPESPTVIPVDIYMTVNNSYLPINLFGAGQVETSASTDRDGNPVVGATVPIVTADKAKVDTDTGYKDLSGNKLKYKYIFDNKQFIDWDNENIRRNTAIGILQKSSEEDYMKYADVFTNIESYGKSAWQEEPNSWEEGTPTISQEWKNSIEVRSKLGNELPYGMYYATGNNQFLNLDKRCRTFMGDSATYNTPINRLLSGNRSTSFTCDYDPLDFEVQGQRWHFTNNLPSSAVAVRAGATCNTLNIKELRRDNYILLTAMDIKAIGSVWTLQYEEGGGNTTMNIQGTRYNIDSITTGKIITVTTIDKSSKDDRSVTGTH